MDPFLMDLASDGMRTIECAVHPARWFAFDQAHALTWSYVPFGPAHLSSVPEAPGLYCFFLGLPPSSLPAVGYPLYVGKTERTLRQRCAEYLTEENRSSGRVRVRTFLKVFKGELHFAAAPFMGDAAALAVIERDAMDALMPPFSDLGFTATVRAKRMAWQ